MVWEESKMDVTRKCKISGTHGFNLVSSNRFAIIEVEAKYGDLIKVNSINGVRFGELWGAFENPLHEDRPIVDDRSKTIVVGGATKETKRVICLIGR